MWHLSTQVNNGLLAIYITVFDPRRGKLRFFTSFLVYALVYTINSSNLRDLGYLKSKVRLCLPAYLLSLLEETTLEATQDGRNRANDKLLASVK